MAELDYSYIFRCSNKTEKECFDRMLFGEKSKYSGIVEEIKKGDTLFLFNVDSALLMGPFIAISNGGENIVAEAWKKGFPWQVKVSLPNVFKPLHKNDVEHIIELYPAYKKFHPIMKIGFQTTKRLVELFKSPDRITREVVVKKLPVGKFKTIDGHYVRSKWEKDIDDWLFKKQIPHAYEHELNIPERMLCDFFIPKNSRFKNQDVYIELWGKNNESYLERREVKLRLYKKYALPLIEFFPDDMQNIQTILPSRLRDAGFNLLNII